VAKHGFILGLTNKLEWFESECGFRETMAFSVGDNQVVDFHLGTISGKSFYEMVLVEPLPNVVLDTRAKIEEIILRSLDETWDNERSCVKLANDLYSFPSNLIRI
jgi:hypothetical protein